jgi:hypothetical protein
MIRKILLVKHLVPSDCACVILEYLFETAYNVHKKHVAKINSIFKHGKNRSHPYKWSIKIVTDLDQDGACFHHYRDVHYDVEFCGKCGEPLRKCNCAIPITAHADMKQYLI